jgi:hypothetical protein
MVAQIINPLPSIQDTLTGQLGELRRAPHSQHLAASLLILVDLLLEGHRSFNPGAVSAARMA